MLRVWGHGETEDQNRLRRMKILFEKRHCIIHGNSRISLKLRNILNQKIAINAEVPLEDTEIMRVMKIMKKFVLKVENQYPLPVDWGKKG